MPEVPGLDADVFFGQNKNLPDWRGTDQEDEDSITPEEREAVSAMLGFDPAELAEEEPSPLEKVRRKYRRDKP